jgi:hypothetical protein
MGTAWLVFPTWTKLINMLFHLNVDFKLQDLSAIFMDLASRLSRYSAAASVLGKIELKATRRVFSLNLSKMLLTNSMDFI